MSKEEFIKMVKRDLDVNDAEAELIYTIKESSSNVYKQISNMTSLIIEIKDDSSYRIDILEKARDAYCSSIIDYLATFSAMTNIAFGSLILKS